MDVHIKANRRISEADFCTWLGSATAGDRLEYHRGHLVIDRDASWLGAAERNELNKVARRAMWAAKLGLVHLIQRRHAPHDYSYIAVACTRPNNRGAK